jgi:hypothetical protein
MPPQRNAPRAEESQGEAHKKSQPLAKLSTMCPAAQGEGGNRRTLTNGTAIRNARKAFTSDIERLATLAYVPQELNWTSTLCRKAFGEMNED